MKTVYKPWGKEEWIELNEFYCYKRIYINAGYKTSFQYHDKKYETNYIISGTAEVWLEDEDGVIQKKIMHAGEFFNVAPPKKHRVIALTDIILQEVSTPHVDDVIRIEDDTNRPNGKIISEHQVPAVLILCAGLGSRLQNMSKNINKVLLPINNKAVISHIIDKFPDNYDIILALGYKGESIKEYCSIIYPHKNITFVQVDDFTSPITGPGYSALQCKHLLQRPFYFITGDCLLETSVPNVTENWIGVTPTEFPEKYSTALVKDGIVEDFKNKSPGGFDNAFIGIASILEYEVFWKELENNIENTGEIVSAFLNVRKYSSMKAKELSWFDTGNVDDLLKARKYFKDKPLSLQKELGEIPYHVNGKFLKYFSNVDKLKKLQLRYEKLHQFAPPNVTFGNYFLSYDWIIGDTLYQHNSVEILKTFLEFLEKQITSCSTLTSTAHCKEFYTHKTRDRIELFLKKFGEQYYNTPYEINGVSYPAMKEVLDNIDFSVLENNPLYPTFHGDLQFENVIYDTHTFYYIDWREDFGGNVEYGDVYYDLAKLMGGLLLPYNKIKDESVLQVSEIKNRITYLDDYTTDTLKKFLPIYKTWLLKNNFDISKISLLVGVIFLNMAPLHEEKFARLLWFKSLVMLHEYQNHH